MNDALYNTYSRLMKLAFENTRIYLCRLNRLAADTRKFSISPRDADGIIDIIEKIMRDSTRAVDIYSDRIEMMTNLSVNLDRFNDACYGQVFVQSILKSRSARICQKKLIDSMAIEMYLAEAYIYDKNHPLRARKDPAIELAKDVVTRLCSVNALTNFVFESGKAPCFDPQMKKMLEQQAYDRRYSIMDAARCKDMINRKYLSDFAPRKEFFIQAKDARDKAMEIEVSTADIKRKAMATLDERSKDFDVIMMTEMYKGAFADFPLQYRRRRFVNLKMRNRDILVAPMRMLATKKQYAQIEAMTKYSYILSYYQNQIPKNITSDRDKEVYLFSQEANMYQYMWGANARVEYTSGKIRFDDGATIDVAKGDRPCDTLHKVNTMYASLFGFNPDDARGGSSWLQDSIRKAYTDEGVATYRLAMISARERGLI